MEKKFNYSVLNYKHSAVLGESLNIAIFVFFQDTGSLDFIYNKKLSRLRSIYPNLSEKTIKFYLKLIEERVNKLQLISDEFLKLEITENFDSFISNHLFPQDESSLQFSNGNVGIQYSKSNEEILSYLSQTFLIDEEESKVSKDYILVQKFYDNLKKEFGENILNYKIEKNFKVRNGTGVEFNFNYAWKNGSLNLVKPLNFDLKEARFISEKAYRNYGLIVDLEEQARENQFKFDYLVGRPRDKKLFKEYDHSIKLLDSLSTLRIIEEEKIGDYSQDAINSLSKDKPTKRRNINLKGNYEKKYWSKKFGVSPDQLERVVEQLHGSTLAEVEDQVHKLFSAKKAK